MSIQVACPARTLTTAPLCEGEGEALLAFLDERQQGRLPILEFIGTQTQSEVERPEACDRKKRKWLSSASDWIAVGWVVFVMSLILLFPASGAAGWSVFTAYPGIATLALLGVAAVLHAWPRTTIAQRTCGPHKVRAPVSQLIPVSAAVVVVVGWSIFSALIGNVSLFVVVAPFFLFSWLMPFGMEFDAILGEDGVGIADSQQAAAWDCVQVAQPLIGDADRFAIWIGWTRATVVIPPAIREETLDLLRLKLPAAVVDSAE